MSAVVAVYPSGRRILVGFVNSQEDVDGLINDCIATNGEEKLREPGIRFNVELVG